VEDGGIAPVILNIGTDGCEWSVTHSGRFTSGAEVPDTLCIGGLVGLRYSLGCFEEVEGLFHVPGIEPLLHILSGIAPRSMP
jgi:hypothetical protein